MKGSTTDRRPGAAPPAGESLLSRGGKPRWNSLRAVPTAPGRFVNLPDELVSDSACISDEFCLGDVLRRDETLDLPT